MFEDFVIGETDSPFVISGLREDFVIGETDSPSVISGLRETVVIVIVW
jgi:hypothetical protein